MIIIMSAQRHIVFTFRHCFSCGSIQVILLADGVFADIRVILYLQRGTIPLAPPSVNRKGEVRERRLVCLAF